MGRALPLTENQKAIIRDNTSRFDADIIKLPGMEGTTTRQVSDYRKKVTRPSTSDARQLATALEQYISDHGLPSQYGIVLKYMHYLQEQG